MKTLKTKTMHVANSVMEYSLRYDGKSYGLEISVHGDFEEHILVEDISCDQEEADKLLETLSVNTVFPSNALEILDDLLGC